MIPEIADAGARRAVEMPADAPLLAITGPAASGKTETLARRYAAILERDLALSPAATIVTASTASGAALLAERIRALLPAERRAIDAPYAGVTLDRLAFDILAEHAPITGLAFSLEAIDAFDAQEIFSRAIAPLFSADWADYLGPEIDPEIPGLRAPDRFAAAVFRLIRKLRDAQIGPDEFVTACLRGAAAFYAATPNLSAPALLFATKDEHRPSLAVAPAELARQRLREIDLAKIIAKIYRSYLSELVAYGCLTAVDAVAEATRVVSEHPAVGRALRQRLALAVVDDVHDLHAGEFALLQAIFGTTLRGVTVAGDPDAATETFAGARPERIFAAAAATIALQGNYRVPPQIAGVVRALLDGDRAVPPPHGDAVRIYRATTQTGEAAFVAASIAALIRDGIEPGRIAVVHRSARCLAAYEGALTARNVPIALQGDAALFARHDALDALALLWSAVDPFAHAWLLRVLQMPLLGLSDATLALLCGEPTSTQQPLFDLPRDEAAEGGRRWDRRRDVRLGTNVVRGDRDADLDRAAVERLVCFRERRERWQQVTRGSDAATAAGAIVTDGGMFLARDAETAARTRLRGAVVERLLGIIRRYAERHPMHDLARALAYCDRIAASDDGPAFDDTSAGGVVVGSIDRIKARRFAHVFVVDVRAGSFPPYYAPDAFLFSAAYGMIPKDNVGDAATSRTAKFTWYQHKAKLRDAFAREHLRALTAALARADVSATVSAWGRATRGVGAPEFLSDLQARCPGVAPAREPPAAPALADTRLPSASPRPAAPAPAAAPTRAVSAEYAAALLACVRCAPRRAMAAALVMPAPLLRDPAAGDELHFTVASGGASVYGSVQTLERDGRRFVLVHGEEAPAHAALATAALTHVEHDAFFVRRDDGSADGPHALDAALAERVAAVLAGRSTPVCAACRAADSV
ncbi:MAG: UvrD-helicase domain-containing protein [Candidatus Velthaea sp.]